MDLNWVFSTPVSVLNLIRHNGLDTLISRLDGPLNSKRQSHGAFVAVNSDSGIHGMPLC